MTQRWPGPIGAVDAPVSGWLDKLPRGGALAKAPDEFTRMAINGAVTSMWERTCRRFPGCVPVAARAGAMPGGTCSWLERMDLSQAFAYPVRNIHRVADVARTGVVTATPTGTWWMEGNRYLHRTTAWPWTPERAHPLAGPGWWIEAAIGADPPDIVLQAAADLADQLLKAWRTPDKCDLPDRVKQIVRRGTTVVFSDPDQVLGLPVVDEATRLYRCHITDGFASGDPATRLRWQDVTGIVPAFDPCVVDEAP